MHTLYLVATPIGNLEDISPRALRILGQVGLIAAEDTRVTAHLLQHFNLQTPLRSYHEHNKLTRLDAILEALASGDVALVSDAGTPAINDPGYELVRAVLAAGHTVTPIPGPSAPIAALSASGLPSDRFLYLGYLPRKHGERCQALQQAASLPYTLIFLETPHRLVEALKDILEILGDRPMAVARELTKLHEEIVRAPVSAALAHFEAQPPRGEITLVIAGASASEERWSDERLLEAIQQRRRQGQAAAQIAAELADLSGWPRKTIYRLVSEQPAEG